MTTTKSSIIKSHKGGNFTDDVFAHSSLNNCVDNKQLSLKFFKKFSGSKSLLLRKNGVINF